MLYWNPRLQRVYWMLLFVLLYSLRCSRVPCRSKGRIARRQWTWSSSEKPLCPAVLIAAKPVPTGLIQQHRDIDCAWNRAAQAASLVSVNALWVSPFSLKHGPDLPWMRVAAFSWGMLCHYSRAWTLLGSGRRFWRLTSIKYQRCLIGFLSGDGLGHSKAEIFPLGVWLCSVCWCSPVVGVGRVPVVQHLDAWGLSKHILYSFILFS